MLKIIGILWHILNSKVRYSAQKFQIFLPNCSIFFTLYVECSEKLLYKKKRIQFHLKQQLLNAHASLQLWKMHCNIEFHWKRTISFKYCNFISTNRIFFILIKYLLQVFIWISRLISRIKGGKLSFHREHNFSCRFSLIIHQVHSVRNNGTGYARFGSP